MIYIYISMNHHIQSIVISGLKLNNYTEIFTEIRMMDWSITDNSHKPLNNNPVGIILLLILNH